MNDKKTYRRFFTDSAYEKDINENADRYIEGSIRYANLPVDIDDLKEGAKGYHPLVDNADLTAEAVLSYISGITGDVFESDHEGNHKSIDTVAAIVRRSAGQSIYEQLPTIDKAKSEVIYSSHPLQPPTNQEHPRYTRALCAINTTHNEFDAGMVFDNWPIDDPYRDTALCILNGMREVIGPTTYRQIFESMTSQQKNELVEVLSAIVELRVPYINSAYENIHQIGDGKLKAPNAVPLMTGQEQIQALATRVHHIAWAWSKRHEVDLGMEERVMGAVHGVLNLLQNGAEGKIPAFSLVPIDPQTDEGCITSIARGDKSVNVDWDYGKPMWLGANVEDGNAFYSENAQSPPGSLTDAFEQQYERIRDRFKTAARDLFEYRS